MDERKLKMPKGVLKFVKGDATLPQGSNMRIILQIVNDIGAYGAGFSGALSKRYPSVESRYKGWWRERYGKLKLGEIQEVQVASDIIVINMISQHGLISKDNPKPFDPDALKVCLGEVYKLIGGQKFNAAIHMPRIGCGLGGGTWEEVEEIVQTELIDKGINVIVYDL